MTMSDIFLKKDAFEILKNKFIVIVGSSVQRSIYKDLVLLLQTNSYLKDGQLRAKGEVSFAKDELIHGGKKGELNNGVHYREVRQYKTDYHLLRFYFVTRSFNNYVKSIFMELKEEPHPDIVIINSCLWDITRYGTNYVDDYRNNLGKLCSCMKECLTDKCLTLWNTTLPVSRTAKGGVFIPEVAHMKNSLQLEVLEANFVARQIVAAHGYDVIDLHHFLRYHLHRRAEDGVHWDMTAHRRMTNLLLTHITEALGKDLPQQTEIAQLAKFHQSEQTNVNLRPRTPPNVNVGYEGRSLPLHNSNMVQRIPKYRQRNFPPSVRFPVPQCRTPRSMNSRPHGLPLGEFPAEQLENYTNLPNKNVLSVEERYGGPIRKSDFGTMNSYHSDEDFGDHYDNCGDQDEDNYDTDYTDSVIFSQGQEEEYYNNNGEYDDEENQYQNPDNQAVQFVDENYDNFGQNEEPFQWQPYARQDYQPPGRQVRLTSHMNPYCPRGVAPGWGPVRVRHPGIRVDYPQRSARYFR